MTSPHPGSQRRLRGGWGSTVREQRAPLPGDDIIGAPLGQTTHAITLQSSPEDVWRWLAQMGYGRGGWYTPTFVDTMWRVRNPSADRIMPEFQDISVGQVILDGPPGTAVFTVVETEPPDVLALHSMRHPLTGTPPDLAARDPGPYLDFSWVFVSRPRANGGTRLLLRTRSVAHPKWLRGGLLMLLPADLYMGRAMLKGIERRVDNPAMHFAEAGAQ